MTLSQTAAGAASYAAASNTLAALYKDRGSFDDAERIYREAIIVAQDSGLVVDQARIWGNLAGLYTDTGRLAEGQVTLEMAERLLTNLNYNIDLQIMRFKKLNILTQLGEWSLAESVARGIDFHSLQQAGSLSYAAASHLVFGQVLAEQKKFDEAEANLREGIAIAQRADAPMQQVFGVTELALFLTKSRRYAEAQHYFEEADQIARENPQSVYLQKMRDEIAEGLASVAEAMKSGADRSGSTP
jgi:tetratricopeptide (TPR) repeat protein